MAIAVPLQIVQALHVLKLNIAGKVNFLLFLPPFNSLEKHPRLYTVEGWEWVFLCYNALGEWGREMKGRVVLE